VEVLESYEKLLSINQEHLPSDHADMARSHHSIAIVYDYFDQYTRAMKHHNQSLEIKLKAYPSYHPSIADSYQCIGLLHYDKSEWKQALEYFKKAAAIYFHLFSSGRPKMIRIESNITRVTLKLK
jgi:tetratricopeptide (TPR) repeat protein